MLLKRKSAMPSMACNTVKDLILRNGLTHLIMMPITPISTTIELFSPKEFAHDYEWTMQALGMKHFTVWNDI
jgi:hypothetical protein